MQLQNGIACVLSVSVSHVCPPSEIGFPFAFSVLRFSRCPFPRHFATPSLSRIPNVVLRPIKACLPFLVCHGSISFYSYSWTGCCTNYIAPEHRREHQVCGESTFASEINSLELIIFVISPSLCELRAHCINVIQQQSYSRHIYHGSSE